MNETLKGLKIAGKTPVVGFGVCMGSVRAAEMAALTSFDYIMIDLLHSHFDRENATSAIRTLARAKGPVPFGRVANNDPGSINELLDAGAMGIIVPMIESPEEARKAVESIYYPPLGKRSKGSPAAAFYGKDYYSKINEEVNAIVMIETAEAAEQAVDILKVPGITGCLIGAGDLLFTMKMANRENHFDETVENVIKAAKLNNIAIGISVGNLIDLNRWWEKGMDFYLTSHDLGLLSTAIQEYSNQFANPEVTERS